MRSHALNAGDIGAREMVDNHMEREQIFRKYSYGLILEVGCAQKRFCSKSVGIDIKRSQLHDRDIVADAQHMPFKDSSFETIFAGEVIEHLENPQLFISEAKRITKNGGRLILTTPNPWCITYVLGEYLGVWRTPSDKEYHKFIWDLKIMKRWLKDEGWKIEASGYCGPSHNVLLKILRKVFPKMHIHIFLVAIKNLAKELNIKK